MTEGRLFFSRHARDRMLDFGLDVTDAATALASGETVEEYEDGTKLVLGRSSGARPLHVVVKELRGTTFVITCYIPDPARWDASFRHRMKP